MSAIPPSPFIEGTTFQYAWDNTSLELLMTCPRKYQLTIIEGWRSKTPSATLDFGKLYHAALEIVDVCVHSGLSLQEALRRAIREVLNATTYRVVRVEGTNFIVSEADPGEKVTLSFWTPLDKYRTREALVRSIVWYYEQYQETLPVVTLPNGKPALELSFSFPMELRKQGHDILWCGHIDKIIEFGPTRMILERKHTKTTLSQHYFDQYAMSNQVTGYIFAGKVCFNVDLRGAVIDAAQLLVDATRYQRSQQLRTPAQLTEWHADTIRWIEHAEAYSAVNYWPMNKASCNNYGGCPFRDVCSSDPSVRASKLNTHFQKRFWNPLQVREPGQTND